MGDALARIVDATGHRVEYRHLDHAYANTTLPGLSALLEQRIEDLEADDPHWIPLHELRTHIELALVAREA